MSILPSVGHWSAKAGEKGVAEGNGVVMRECCNSGLQFIDCMELRVDN